ncbi:MAG: hypothetical protein COV34_01550 [Candidatus Zambryskibacteria bacterium CG10_big_fil_rev_8_21_14_0_10_42_12]|uniref:Carbohydrate kinase PfkB domain-containing protein n=1 Tax=Candidatus Zambryskibacteria bacterium CG10_big_fil_rev_8_21_14_0_10_42_12 TaxID=1975115 RepID=A0A2H0QWB2_9BACT|nr:MAG: hypothetical protein COV34_01550 [Candidatus Zambryskibacteria bacterium CG10_big_fil_rev_8_21_14_0_10_42_12]
MAHIDFLGIGDIVTDAFIELQDATVNCDISKENCQICMRFGDKIPYKDVTVVPAVGNSPNAAVSAHRLGLNSAILTEIGDDRTGDECLEALKKEGVGTDYVNVHTGEKTNYHYVLSYEAERTILIKHTEFAYKLPNFSENPRWVYLSSLGENSLSYQKEIASWIKANPDIKLAFQPGTFQIKMSDELSELYEIAEISFCNKEEAKRILHKSPESSDDIKTLIADMHKKGPRIVVITDGPEGAYASDGATVWHMPMYPDIAPPVDRTGAGDSFSSTFTCALALGMSIPEALSWGPINSMSVVQYMGAQKGLLSREKLEEYLAKAPEDYKPKEI